MFKDMDADPLPKSAGILLIGHMVRCWQSDDGQCIIWFGEEDQLRIMCMKKHKVERSFHALERYVTRSSPLMGSNLRSVSMDTLPPVQVTLALVCRLDPYQNPNCASDGTDRRQSKLLVH